MADTVTAIINSFVGPDLDSNCLNSADPGQMDRHPTFDLGFHCVCFAGSYAFVLSCLRTFCWQ